MLKIEHLDLFYGDVQSLFDVNMHLEKNMLTAIIGGNGAGKTSLIRTICGIYSPSLGKILFQDEDITGLGSHEIAERGMGHVAEGRQIFPTMTVLENLHIGGSLKRSKKRLKSNMDHVFDLFPRLKERASQAAGTLSGGEQQMLAIGRCLMGEPTLMLLDEPSLGLSPIMVQDMFRIIQQLHQSGMTLVLIEQNVVASLDLASKAFVLENGQVTLSGAAQDLRHNDDVKRAYLGI